MKFLKDALIELADSWEESPDNVVVTTILSIIMITFCFILPLVFFTIPMLMLMGFAITVSLMVWGLICLGRHFRKNSLEQ